MLIPSHRHTRSDLDLWMDYEEADHVHGAAFLEGGGASRSIEAVRTFAAQGAAYLGVIWGKDSVAAAHICREACPEVPLVHLRALNHNPDADLVRNAYFELFPGQTYREQGVHYDVLDGLGLSPAQRDRAEEWMWYSAFDRAREKWGLATRYISGVRDGEGLNRRLRCLRWGVSTPNTCAPLAWWTTRDVFGYLAVMGLPVHPAYACLGGGRWERDRIRVAEIGDPEGSGGGRREWEREYYGEALNRMEAYQARRRRAR